MGDWKIIVPESTQNIYDNPVFGKGTTGWTIAGSGATATRGTTYSKWGAYSVKVDVAAANCQYYESLTVTAISHTLSFHARNAAGTQPAGLTAWFNNGSVTPATVKALGDGWYYYTYTGTPTAGSRQFGVRVSASQADIWVDGFQLEAKAYATTHCNGDVDGCEWNGAKHASTSRRSAGWRGGGREYDLKDDYGFSVTRATGVGAAAILLSRQPYAAVPGSRLTSMQRPERVFTLTGNIIPNNTTSTHSRRVELTKILSPDAYPEYRGKAQPVRLRYEGAATIKEIAAHYEGGLEANWTRREEYNFEEATIRFFCEDPFWYEIGESAKALDTRDSGIMYNAVAYLKGLGRWDTLNINNPCTNFTVLRSVTRMSNGKVWFCGDFEGWNGTAGMDMIAVFDPDTRQWEKAGPGTSFHDAVWCAVQAANGTVYVGGAFNPGDGSLVTHIAKLINESNTWETIGTPGTFYNIRDIAFTSQGEMYVVGRFANLAGINNADGIAKWDGDNWNRVGNSDLSDTYAVTSIVLDAEDHPYIIGSFLNFAGSALLDYAGRYNGTTWARFGGTAIGNTANRGKFDPSGQLYIVGNFTSPGTYVMKYNGNSFEDLGDGLSGNTWGLARGPDGMWYFTNVSGQAIHKWDGVEFSRAAITLPTLSTWSDVDLGLADPLLKSSYDVWLASKGTGTVYFAGTATVTHDGSGKAYPYLKVKREGGTSATLISLRNNMTGEEISFDYDLQDGEELTVDLRPHRRNIVSSMRGQQWAAARRGSSIGPFHLQRGDNNILAYVEQSGGTVTANLIWRDTFEGFDG